MKRILFSALCLMTAAFASAAEVWEGSHPVSWDNTLTVEADKFVEATVGQKLVFEFTEATGEVIEIHSDGGMLPGTRFAHFIYPDNSNIEVFITPAMLAQLQATGLEVCGVGFTLTKIALEEGKDNVTAETVWTGYYWMDEWSTLEITKNSFAGIDWSNYKAIRFCSEAGRTDYVINIKTSWEEAGHIADAGTMTMTDDYAELSLDGIDMAARLESSDRLMIQCNKEGGAPFNFTSVELVPAEGAAIDRVEVNATATQCFDLYGRKSTAEAKGFVINPGKQSIVVIR